MRTMMMVMRSGEDYLAREGEEVLAWNRKRRSSDIELLLTYPNDSPLLSAYQMQQRDSQAIPAPSPGVRFYMGPMPHGRRAKIEVTKKACLHQEQDMELYMGRNNNNNTNNSKKTLVFRGRHFRTLLFSMTSLEKANYRWKKYHIKHMSY